MKYNENLVNEYGRVETFISEAPSPAKPMPSSSDYTNGTFKRAFAKKINDNRIFEISIEQANRLNTDIYIVVTAQWTISGPRETRMVNGILEHGVSQMNRFEIDRIKKEESVDLSGVLTNMLEYWIGH